MKSIMDFQPLDRTSADPSAQNMEVLLAVAQEELINNHVQALQAAGLKPTAIDVEPLAASRALIDAASFGPPMGVFGIVNIGCKNTDLSVFEDGILTFPSPPLGIAGTTLTQEISEAMGLTLEQAELTKREYAAVDLDGFPAPGTLERRAGHVGTRHRSGPRSARHSTLILTWAPESPPRVDRSPAGPRARWMALWSMPSADQSRILEPAASAEPVAGPGRGGESGRGIRIGGTGGQEQPVPIFDFGSPDTPVEAGPAEDPNPSGRLRSSTLGTMSRTRAWITKPWRRSSISAIPMKVGTPAIRWTTKNSIRPIQNPSAEAVPVAPKKVLSEMEQNVFKAISGPLMDLAVELRRSLEYYSTKYSKVPMKIYLCGGTAKIPNLDKFLSSELGIAVEVADPLKRLRVSAPSVSPPYMKEIAPLMSVSVGLAIRDMLDESA